MRRAWHVWRGGVHNSTAVMGCLSVLAAFALIVYLVVLAVRAG